MAISSHEPFGAPSQRSGRLGLVLAGSLTILTLLLPWTATALAQSVSPTPQPEGTPITAEEAAEIVPESWAIHGQSTYTQQFQPAFRSPYVGAQSLTPSSNGRETFDATLFLGVRPWQGAEIWVNPEFDQGFGLSNSFGVAGYLSGEAYTLGNVDPYYRMARAFFRQTISLGGEAQKLDADLNQLGGTQTANRIVLTAGKFGVTDIFDTNKYAHDPRNDFLNWSIIDAGTFDYAADAWGVTYGAAAEWYQDRFVMRLGMFDMSNIPNSTQLSLPLLQQTQMAAELEENHTVFDQPGKLKILYWLSRANMGTYDDALAAVQGTGVAPSVSSVRNYRSKYGIILNLEQQVTPDMGIFARLGWTQPGVQEYDFTDIDRTFSAGLSLSGNSWGRSDDTVGLAFALNQISHDGQAYLAAGGMGGIIGDGKLPSPGTEQILEMYYSAAITSYAKLTADYQFVNNPAYNQQRGPVSAFAARVHLQF